MTTARLLGALLVTAAMLVAVPAAAAAPTVFWTPMRFSDDSKAKTVSYANGEKVSGSIFICNEDGGNRTLSIGEYVRTGPQDYSLWRAESKPLNASGGCPGYVPVSWDIQPGPSRSLNFAYSSTGPAGAGYVGNFESVLELTVSYQLTLAASDRKVRNGDSVFFSGVMPAYFFSGPPGLLLQVRVGKKWRTFKTLQTLGDGSYFGTYRFTNTRSRQTYKFRAKPFGASLYPVAVTPSKKVKVKVKP
jgi:hypothetical protein